MSRVSLQAEGRPSVPTRAVVLTAALLAGCVPAEPIPPEPTAPAPRAVAVTKRQTIYADQTGNRIWVACHNGRLLYVFDSYKAGGLDVIDGAPECRDTTASAVGTKDEVRSEPNPTETGRMEP